jgi:hypothetical protein
VKLKSRLKKKCKRYSLFGIKREGKMKRYKYFKIKMSEKIFLSILIISVSTIDAFLEDPSKVYTVTCRTDYCKEALESCIAKNCYGARGCKSLIELSYPVCTRCVDDILDQNNYELV